VVLKIWFSPMLFITTCTYLESAILHIRKPILYAWATTMLTRPKGNYTLFDKLNYSLYIVLLSIGSDHFEAFAFAKIWRKYLELANPITIPFLISFLLPPMDARVEVVECHGSPSILLKVNPLPQTSIHQKFTSIVR